MGYPHCISGPGSCVYSYDEIEEEEYFIDQLRTHKGHSNYNDWQYGIQTYNVHNNNKEILMSYNYI